MSCNTNTMLMHLKRRLAIIYIITNSTSYYILSYIFGNFLENLHLWPTNLNKVANLQHKILFDCMLSVVMLIVF
jgi:hypothetical protein